MVQLHLDNGRTMFSIVNAIAFKRDIDRLEDKCGSFCIYLNSIGNERWDRSNVVNFIFQIVDNPLKRGELAIGRSICIISINNN